MNPPASHPIRAILKLHHRCNNRCLFCHAAGRTGELDVQAALRKIDRCRQSGVGQVLFSGGEPTLYPQLPLLARHAARLGMSFGLVSNLRTLAYPEHAARLVRLGLAWVYASIYGPEAAVHDRISAAPGSFEQTVAGIRNVKAALPPGTPLTLNMVVVRSNAAHVSRTARLAESLGADRFKLSVPEIKGRLRSAIDELLPLDQTAAVALAASEELAGSPTAVVCDGLPRCLVPDRMIATAPRDNIRLMSEVEEERLHPTDESGREYPAGCLDCSLAGFVCPGIYQGYGAAGLAGVRPRNEPVPNVWRFEPAGAGPVGTPPVIVCNGLIYASADRPCEGPLLLALNEGRACMQRGATLHDFRTDLERLEPPRPGPSDAAVELRPDGRRRLFEAEERPVVDYLDRLRGRVLDVGAGPGFYRELLARKVEAGEIAYFAIDPDPEACATLSSAHPGFSVITGEIETTGLPTGLPFSHALLLRSWNHLRDLDRALERIAGLLLPGGSLLAVDNLPFVLLGPSVHGSAGRPGDPGHFRNHGSMAAAAALRTKGFVIERETPVTPDGDNQWLVIARKPG